ncbi:MAG: DUF1127 domain-containing protein [Rhodospirillaceae bacterium]|nr:DUF1127 domain-containing protein [Rhodospirillaceae bacterium]
MAMNFQDAPTSGHRAPILKRVAVWLATHRPANRNQKPRRETLDALVSLNDRTLSDLGLQRTDITFITAQSKTHFGGK